MCWNSSSRNVLLQGFSESPVQKERLWSKVLSDIQNGCPALLVTDQFKTGQ
jgi:hypothetical protein